MPHFIVDCSDTITNYCSSDLLMRTIFETAKSSELFDPENIKVRIKMFKHYTVADKKNDFIHIIAYIMEGRTMDQKQSLSEQIIIQLKKILNNIPVLSIDIRDINRTSYCNKYLV